MPFEERMSRLSVLLLGCYGLALTSSYVNAFDQVIISSEWGTIKQLCESSCLRDTEASLAEHCQRGCRFYDLSVQSNVLDLKPNETLALTSCVDSCNEAYTAEHNRLACTTGCNQSVVEIERMDQMAKSLLEETEKQVNFFSTIMDMMNFRFGFMSRIPTDDLDLSEEDVMNDLRPLLGKSSVQIGLLDDEMSKVNQMELELAPNSDVEIIQLAGNGFPIMSDRGQAGPRLCQSRNWLHALVFILIVLATLLLLCGCYIFAVYRLKKAKVNGKCDSMLESVTESSSPPSYDTLLRNGYIVLSKNDTALMQGTATYAHSADEKVLVA